MLNIKNVLNSIRYKISYLKNGHWHLYNYNGKLLPNSTVVLSALDSNISIIRDFIYSLPNHRNIEKRKSEIDVVASTYNIGIYSNHSKENFESITAPTIYDIPLCVKDENDNIIDARVSGGGVTKQYVNDMIGTDKFINSYTDIGRWDGLPTAASTAVMIELPSSIKDIYTEEYILSVVKKYMVLGTHPVIKYYDGNSLASYGYLFA